jgi:hypothetical protein
MHLLHGEAPNWQSLSCVSGERYMNLNNARVPDIPPQGPSQYVC